MASDLTPETRIVIDRFYAAYLAGDQAAMLAQLADDAVVTFVGHGTFRGKDEIRPYLAWAATQLPELDFRVTATIVDGDRAAVTWDETGRTRRGDRWAAVGVDVYRVVAGKVAKLTVHSDTDQMRRLLDPYPGPSVSIGRSGHV
jgi:uncharacterized protein (TIGR02246 family)